MASEDVIQARRPGPWWDDALLCLSICRESSRRMNHNAWHIFIIKPIIFLVTNYLIDICNLTFFSLLFHTIVVKVFHLSLSNHEFPLRKINIRHSQTFKSFHTKSSMLFNSMGVNYWWSLCYCNYRNKKSVCVFTTHIFLRIFWPLAK